jgi:hypothetical protein
MFWNYRLILNEAEDTIELHEVHYDEENENSIVSWTENPLLSWDADSYMDVRKDFEFMRAALDKAILRVSRDSHNEESLVETFLEIP